MIFDKLLAALHINEEDDSQTNVENGCKQSSVLVESHNHPTTPVSNNNNGKTQFQTEVDPYFVSAGYLIIERNRASITMLQCAVHISYRRAANIIYQLYEAGVVGPETGTASRAVCMSKNEFKDLENSGKLNIKNLSSADISVNPSLTDSEYHKIFLNIGVFVTKYKILDETDIANKLQIPIEIVHKCFLDLEHADIIHFDDTQYIILKTTDEFIYKFKGRHIVDSAPFDIMNGIEFENFCAHLLSKNGFEIIKMTKASGDQGIDIIAADANMRYGVQCKCYSSNVSNKAVQEAFAGSLYYDCHIPIVLTNRYFTKSATELASKLNVLLWDRDKLNALIYNTKYA